jgi:hypothetical protein
MTRSQLLALGQALPILKLLLMCACFWIALAAWALASPVGSSPDEDFHQTMIYCSASGDSALCLNNGVRVGSCYTMSPTVSASCSNDATNVLPSATKIDLLQTLPIYYKTMSYLIGQNLGETTINVRLANVTLAVLFAIFSVHLTHPSFKRPVAISWVISSVPVGIYFIASINTSAWIIISVAALWGPLITILMAHKTSFSSNIYSINFYLIRILFVLLACLVAFGARNEAFIYIPLTFCLAFLYFFVDFNVNFKQIKLKKIITIFSIIFITLFFLYLFLSYIDQPFLKAEAHLRNSLFHVLTEYFSNPTWKTFQLSANSLLGTFALTGVPGSEIGTHDVPTPALASFFITFSFAGSFLLGIGNIYRAKAISLTFTICSLFFIVTLLWSAATWDIHQSRYFLPMVYVILGLALLPKLGESFSYNKMQWFFILISAAIANCLMLLSTVLRFIYGAFFQKTRYPLNLEAPEINPAKLFYADLPNWWLGHETLTPFILWVFGSFSFLFGVILLWCWVIESKPTPCSK